MCLPPARGDAATSRCCRISGRACGVHVLQLSDAGDAVFRKAALQRLARAANEADRLVAEKRFRLCLADHGEAARLVEFRGELGQEFVVAEPDGGGDADLALNAFGQLRHGPCRRQSVQPFGAGKIEKGFVQRQWFDERRELAHKRTHRAGGFGIFLHVRTHDDSIGAQLPGLEHRHGGFDAEGARHIAGRRHDAARSATDDDWLVEEVGIVPFFDRGIERVAVDMGDAQRIELDMRNDAAAAAGLAARCTFRNVGKAIAAEGAHAPRLWAISSSRHSHAAPRTPLESPCMSANDTRGAFGCERVALHARGQFRVKRVDLGKSAAENDGVGIEDIDEGRNRARETVEKQIHRRGGVRFTTRGRFRDFGAGEFASRAALILRHQCGAAAPALDAADIAAIADWSGQFVGPG